MQFNKSLLIITFHLCSPHLCTLAFARNSPTHKIIPLSKSNRRTSQFHAHFYFVRRTTKASKKFQRQPFSSKLYKFLNTKFPEKNDWSLINYTYIQTTNDYLTKSKLSQNPKVSAPTLQFLLRRNERQPEFLSLEMKISHFEVYRTATKLGPNTRFVTSERLSTKLFVKTGTFYIVGRTSIQEQKTNSYQRVYLIARIEREQKSPFAVNHTKSSILAKLTRTMITTPIKRHARQFKSCYEVLLAKKPRSKGKLVLSFIITPSGQVQSPKIHETSFQDEHIKKCFLKEIKEIRFPKASEKTKVNYPFSFHPS